MSHALVLTEWQSAHPSTCPGLAELRLSTSEAVQANALRQARQLDLIELREGLSIRTRSWVGHLELGALRLTIRPKLDKMLLLPLLRYVWGLRQLHLLPLTDTDTDLDAFEDLLLTQLLAETQELLTRGLHRTWSPRQEPLSAPRGKILVERVARQASGDQTRLPCRWHPRAANTPLNLVLLAGLYSGSRLTRSVELRAELRGLARRMPEELPVVELSERLLDDATRHLTRQTHAYLPALTLLRLLLRGHGGTLLPGTSPLPGFLFDMNRFFQALLARLMRDHLEGVELIEELPLTDLYRWAPDSRSPRTRPPTPRPDFVVQRRGQVIAVLDAKYRDLWSHPLTRDMVYQLTVYTMAFPECPTATILYPTLDPAAHETRLHVGRGAGRREIALRPVQLGEVVRALREDDRAGLMTLAKGWVER